LAGALVGLYAGRSGVLGTLGSVGFLVAFVGTVLVAGAYWQQAFIVPDLAREVPELVETVPPALLVGFFLSLVPFSLGWLLFGVAAFRTRAYPRAAAALLAVGALLTFVSVPFTSVVFAMAVAWMGLSLLPGKTEAVGRAPRVG
jgi:hypothetical protein